jgi:hypothetical protein
VLTSASNLSLQRPITPKVQEKTQPNGVGEAKAEDKSEDEPRTLTVPPQNVVPSAHYGYIYCMALVRDDTGDNVRLVTGSGDEHTKARLVSSLLFIPHSPSI